MLLIFAACALGPLSAAEAPPRLTQEPFWLKTYSLTPFKEYWTLELEVKSMPKDLPKVLQALSKAGAVPSLPLENMAYSKTEKSQQLSYRLSLASAAKILKRLKKLGRLAEPKIRAEPDRPPLPEVKDKIERLLKLKKERPADLARLPDVPAIVDELLERLLLVEHVAQETGSEVLLSMTVRQAPTVAPR